MAAGYLGTCCLCEFGGMAVHRSTYRVTGTSVVHTGSFPHPQSSNTFYLVICIDTYTHTYIYQPICLQLPVRFILTASFEYFVEYAAVLCVQISYIKGTVYTYFREVFKFETNSPVYASARSCDSPSMQASYWGSDCQQFVKWKISPQRESFFRFFPAVATSF